MIFVVVVATLVLLVMAGVWLPTIPLRAALREVPAAQDAAYSRDHLPVEEVDAVYERLVKAMFKSLDCAAVTSLRSLLGMVCGLLMLTIVMMIAAEVRGTEMPGWSTWVLYGFWGLGLLGFVVAVLISQYLAAHYKAEAVRFEATLTARERTLGHARMEQRVKREYTQRIRVLEEELAQLERGERS